jgi:PIN like domain
MLGRARWYVDADTLGLAHVLIRARPDVTFCGDDGKRHQPRWNLPPSPVQDTATKDAVWIPAVTAAGLIILTRDRRIALRTAEIDAVVTSRARMFAITSTENLDVWGQLEVVVGQWRTMEDLAGEAGPFIYGLTRTGAPQRIV